MPFSQQEGNSESMAGGATRMSATSDSFESLRYAVRALRSEFLQFRFDYPIEIDPDAGPKESLHYYLYSDGLSWDIMSMDPTGVPRVRTRLAGVIYKPAYIGGGDWSSSGTSCGTTMKPVASRSSNR
jgi:hypothetical protein